MSLCVDVRDLTRKFGAFVAVDKVSFQIESGSIFGFLGPNGAGKSTVIRMLLGILQVSSGSGTVLGHDIRTEGRSIRARVGYMSQKFSLYEDLTVLENMRFFAGIFGLSRVRRDQRVDELLERCRLRGHENQLAFDLPGGIRQRLAFSVALLHDPDIVFLDEPTGGMDPSQRRYFWDLIVGLAQDKKTVMVTTHYMDEVERCDRICFIYGGKLIAQGSPTGLKRDQIRGQLYQFTPRGRLQAMQALEGLPGVEHPFPAGADVRFLWSGQGQPAPAREALKGLVEGEVEPVSATLEDVFIALVAGGSAT